MKANAIFFVFIFFLSYLSEESSAQTKLYPVRNLNKYGAVDSELRVVIPIIYDQLRVENEVVIAKRNNEFTLFDFFGKPLIEQSFDSVRIENNCLIIGRNKLFGLYHCKGKQLIDIQLFSIESVENAFVLTDPAQRKRIYFPNTEKYGPFFDSILFLSSDFIILNINRKKELINTKSNYISSAYDTIVPFENNIFFARQNDSMFFINGSSEKIYETGANITYSDERIFGFKTKTGFILRKRNDISVFELQADSVKEAFSIIEKTTGGISSFLESDEDKFFVFIYKNGKIGLMDQAGTKILPPRFDMITPSKKNIQVFESGKTGLYDKNGKLILPVQYEDFTYGTNCFIVKFEQKYGIYSENRETIKPKYKEIKQLNDNYFSFSRSRTKGIVSKFGNEITADSYDDFFLFDKAIIYRLGKKSGLMDYRGQKKTEARFSTINALNDDFFLFGETGKTGIIRFDGQQVSETPYHEVKASDINTVFKVSGFEEIHFRVENDSREFTKRRQGYINAFGEVLLDTLYFPEQIDEDFETGCIRAFHDSSVTVVSLDASGKLYDKSHYSNYIRVKKKPAVNRKNKWKSDKALWGLFTYNDLPILRYQFSEISCDFSGNTDVTLVRQVSETGNQIGYGIVDDKTGKFRVYPDFDIIHTQDFKNSGVARCIDLSNKVRLIDRTCTQLPEVYAYVGEFREGFARFCKSGKSEYRKPGKYSLEINLVSPQIRVLFQLFRPAKKNDLQFSIVQGKWGILDTTGKQVVDARYDFVQEYFNGIFLCEKNTKFGAVDSRGNTIIDFKYNDLSYIRQESDPNEPLKMKYLKARIKNKYGIIDYRGNTIIPAEYSDIYSVNTLTDTFFIALKKFGNKTAGLIDTAGNLILQPSFETIDAFNDNLSRVKGSGNRYGFINRQGQLIIDTIYSETHGFSQKRASVKFKNEWIFIDTAGKKCFNNTYFYAGTFRNTLAPVAQIRKKSLLKKRQILYGYIDSEGNQTIKLRFEHAEDFDNSYAIVCIKKKSGIIDTTGKYALKPSYDYIEKSSLSQQYIGISKQEIYLLFPDKKTARKVTDSDTLSGFSNFVNSAVTKKNPGNIKNNKPEYHNLNLSKSNESRSTMVFRSTQLKAVFDKTGKCLAPCAFDNITIEDGKFLRFENTSKSFYIKPN